MNYDFDLCDGITSDNKMGPLRYNCKRFMEEAEKGYAWWLDFAPYGNGKCGLQIKINDEKEDKKNG